MRTRSNIYFGEGWERGLKILSEFYPGGNVNVVYEDRLCGENLCKLLKQAGYEPDLRHFSAPDFPKSGFLLSHGGERSVRAAAKTSLGRFAHFPTFLCPESFVKTDGKYAEFAYFNENYFNPDNPRAAAECHCALFCVFTEALSLYYSDVGNPFCDRTLLSLINRAKTFLTGKADREGYFREATFLAKNIYETLEKRNCDRLAACELGCAIGGGLENRYSAAYFLDMLLILFTKWNFRDMLIPAEETVAYRHKYGADDLVFTREELRAAVKRVREFTVRPDLKALVSGLRRIKFNENSLFKTIYGRGFAEGLINYG